MGLGVPLKYEVGDTSGPFAGKILIPSSPLLWQAESTQFERVTSKRIGLYDEMEGWGAENVEMSMRVWMCGGSIKHSMLYCSSTYLEQKNPTKFPGTNVHKVLMHNTKRTVDVWFDPPYRDLFYRLQGRAQDTDRGCKQSHGAPQKSQMQVIRVVSSNLMVTMLRFL